MSCSYRIQLTRRLRCSGHALDADERLFNVPGCQHGHIALQAARKPQQGQAAAESTSVRLRDTNASSRLHHGHRHAAGRLYATHRQNTCNSDGGDGTTSIRPAARCQARIFLVSFWYQKLRRTDIRSLLNNRRRVPTYMQVGQLIEDDPEKLFFETQYTTSPDCWSLGSWGWALPWQFGTS